MDEKATQNLAKAFAEEAKGDVRYAAYALQAEKEKCPRLARLFRALSNAKSIHARRFLYLLRGKIGNTEENVKAALSDEKKLLEGMYPHGGGGQRSEQGRQKGLHPLPQDGR
jgi:rubrerythrin